MNREEIEKIIADCDVKIQERQFFLQQNDPLFVGWINRRKAYAEVLESLEEKPPNKKTTKSE